MEEKKEKTLTFLKAMSLMIGASLYEKLIPNWKVSKMRMICFILKLMPCSSLQTGFIQFDLRTNTVSRKRYYFDKPQRSFSKYLAVKISHLNLRFKIRRCDASFTKKPARIFFHSLLSCNFMQIFVKN